MSLIQAFTKAQTIAALRDIFSKDVEVSLGCINDIVTVKGYKDSISTDAIANKMMANFSNAQNEPGAPELAELLAKKVFHPLKRLVEARQNRCVFYQIAALTRMTWTPRPASEFGYSIALKHAICLGCLDQNNYPW